MLDSLVVPCAAPLLSRGSSKCSLGLLALLALSTVVCSAKPAIALPNPDSASSLLPLEEGRPAHPEAVELSATEEHINADFSESQNPEANSNELDIDKVPIVGDLLDENGKFNWGMDMPVTFDFGSLVGNPVLIVGTDFTVD